MTEARPIVFFEVYSPLQVVACARSIRAAQTVVFSRRTPFVPPPARPVRLCRRIVRLLNASAPVRELTVGDLLEYLPLNAEAPFRLDSMREAIASTPSYGRLRRVIQSDTLVKYFQAAESMQAANWTLFPSAAGRLAAGARVVAVPDWDTQQMAESWPAGVTIAGTAANAVRRAAAMWRAAWQAVLLPLGLLARLARNGWRHAPPAGPYAVAMPVVWGLDAQPAGAPKRPHADDYLYGDLLRAGDVLHVFGDYSLGRDQEARSREAMASRGYAWADKRAFALTASTVRAAVRASATLLPLLAPRRIQPVDALVRRNIPKAVYHYLRKTLELANVRCKVELVRNDYNPGHVVAAIASREHGMATVAVQHNALPYEGPQIAFIEADHFAIYGDFYRKGYAPFWDRVKLHHTGRESLDWTMGVQLQPSRLASVRQRWAAYRPKARPMALIVFPGDREICIEPQWHALYEGLTTAAAGRDVDVVLRFRNRKSIDGAHVRQFAELAASNDKFVVVWDEFTTYELMAISDVVISHDGSFTVNEAIALGRPTFSFEFVVAGRHYFKDYGRDFVLSSPADVVRVVEAVGTGYAHFDVDWVGLARDLNAHADGGNRARLRAVIEAAAGLPAGPAAVMNS